MSPGNSAGVAVSRLALEHELRLRVGAFENVQIWSGHEVHGVIVDAGRVSAVRVRDGLGGSKALTSELFVDCSGRGSRLGSWLETYGYRPPDVESVDINVVYITANFPRLPSEDGLAAVVCGPTPERPWAAAAVAQEAVDGCPSWIASVSGYGMDAPRANLHAFRARAGLVGSTDLARIVAREPISTIRRYGFPSSQRRRFERVAKFPEGVVAMGDALASFNPVYGQGMTVAAWQGTALAAELDRGLSGLARRFHRRAARIIDIPWQTAVLADLALPAVPGELGVANRLLARYIARLQRVAVDDPEVAKAFIRVTHMLDRPEQLMKPRILARVLRGPQLRQAQPARSSRVKVRQAEA
jgi:2-polyprenyl-6-methoxyphenol hydroxylase-like FAD-dependent oxidoreductase